MLPPSSHQVRGKGNKERERVRARERERKGEKARSIIASTGNTHERSSKVTETGRGRESRHTHWFIERAHLTYGLYLSSSLCCVFFFSLLILFLSLSFSLLPHRLFRPLTCSISTCPVVFYFSVSFILVSSFSWPQRHQFTQEKRRKSEDVLS